MKGRKNKVVDGQIFVKASNFGPPSYPVSFDHVVTELLEICETRLARFFVVYETPEDEVTRLSDILKPDLVEFVKNPVNKKPLNLVNLLEDVQ